MSELKTIWNIVKPNLVKLASYPAPVRLGVFLVTLLLFWLPIAVPIYLLVRDPNLVTILAMGLLFGEFLFLLRLWGRKVYRQPQLLKSYRKISTWQNGLDLLKGLGVGLLFTFGLFVLQGVLGWLEFQLPQGVLPQIILEGLLSGLGIAFAEGLVFRGWLLEELQRDYSQRTSLWVDATSYAVLHFLKPLEEIIRLLPEFPGLLLLGLTLVWAKRSRRGELGLSIGLHAGLVWGYYILKIGQIVQYSDQVSPWVTGVDGNPIAGSLGLVFLGILAFWMRKRALQNFEPSLT